MKSTNICRQKSNKTPRFLSQIYQNHNISATFSYLICYIHNKNTPEKNKPHRQIITTTTRNGVEKRGFEKNLMGRYRTAGVFPI